MKLFSVIGLLVGISILPTAFAQETLPLLVVKRVPAPGAFGEMGFTTLPDLDLPNCKVHVSALPSESEGAVFVSAASSDCKFIRIEGETIRTYNYNQGGISPNGGAEASIYGKKGKKITVEVANFGSTVLDKFEVQF
jgi:hypothetical protein